MGIIKKILLISLIVGVLIACNQTYISDSNVLYEQDFPENFCDTFGVILPHHLLVEKYINEVYASLSDCGYERIIVLSPNHFNYGARYIQSSDKQILLEGGNALDVEGILKLKRNSPLAIEPKYFAKEHGITVHLDFIKNYFPQARVIPIIIKKGTPVNQLQFLLVEILSLDLHKTLIVASIDFTHFENEQSAIQNDLNTVKWLKDFSAGGNHHNLYPEILSLSEALDKTDEEAVAFDSAETLYVFLSLMEKNKNLTFSFLRRTSSASILGVSNPSDNTSHIFAMFSK